MVTMPVPPMPVTITPIGLVDRAAAPVPAVPPHRPRSSMPLPRLSLAPSTVTKDGQKPFRQEKSLLQLDWSMVRLRPNSVSSGCTETQFDLHAAIAAAFADQFIDDDALIRVRELAALAAAALLGGAGLVVDQHGAAGHFG